MDINNLLDHLIYEAETADPDDDETMEPETRSYRAGYADALYWALAVVEEYVYGEETEMGELEEYETEIVALQQRVRTLELTNAALRESLAAYEVELDDEFGYGYDYVYDYEGEECPFCGDED